MKVNIIQTITKILDENRQTINSAVSETYMLYPAAGKAIKNIKTGKVYTHSVNIGTSGQIKDYIEIDL
jgi:hypothetical protein